MQSRNARANAHSGYQATAFICRPDKGERGYKQKDVQTPRQWTRFMGLSDFQHCDSSRTTADTLGACPFILALTSMVKMNGRLPSGIVKLSGLDAMARDNASEDGWTKRGLRDEFGLRYMPCRCNALQ